MRHTAEPNADVRDVPPGEVWVGVLDDPARVVLVTPSIDDTDAITLMCSLKPDEARQMGQELIRAAASVLAHDN